MNFNQIHVCTCGAHKKCSCDAAQLFLEYQQKQHVIIFLMGLNKEFFGIRGQILLMDLLPTITKVYSLVIQEEK